jgi:hypothetical protein
MVSAYVLVSVEAGKDQGVVAALRQVAGVTQAHACWGQPARHLRLHRSRDDSAMADTVLVTVQAIRRVRATEPMSWRRCREPCKRRPAVIDPERRRR